MTITNIICPAHCPLTKKNNLREEDVTDSEEDVTDSEEESEPHQNSSPKVNKSEETYDMQEGHTNDSSENSKVQELPHEDQIYCLDEDSGARQEILPIMDLLNSVSDLIDEPENE